MKQLDMDLLKAAFSVLGGLGKEIHVILHDCPSWYGYEEFDRCSPPEDCRRCWSKVISGEFKKKEDTANAETETSQTT